MKPEEHQAETAPPSAPALAKPRPAQAALSSQQKAAIIVGVLGTDIAIPLLERLDDTALRSFTQAMSRLRNVDPDTVRIIIAEFLDTLEQSRVSVRGGPDAVRSFLEPMLTESELNRLLDEADTPSVNNVWKKLSKVNEDALAEFLTREHPQTAALVLSKLSSEHAAKILSRMPVETAQKLVIGLTRASSLDANVIEAIGSSVSQDFLASQQHSGPRQNPAERIGSIMNYTTPDTRAPVLDHLMEVQPELGEEVRRKMFTFEDIPNRVPQKSVTAIVATADRETFLKALAGAEENAPAARAYLLENVANRVGTQLNDGLVELGSVSRREAEAAQTDIVVTIRALEKAGELKLISVDNDA